jgi:hypothetical protein
MKEKHKNGRKGKSRLKKGRIGEDEEKDNNNL